MKPFPYKVIYLSVAVTLGGCMVGPAYQKPTPALVSNFNNSSLLDQHQSAIRNADLSQWWNGFNDELLSKVINRSLSQNLSLQQVVARVGQAHAQMVATGTLLKPSANLNAEATKAHVSIEEPLGQLLNATPNFDRNSSLYDINASVGINIDASGGYRREIEASIAEYQASQAAANAVRLAITSQVAENYVMIRTLQTRLAIAKESVEIQAKLVDLVKLQLSRGIVPEYELNQAEGALAEVQASIPALENNLEVTMNALDVLLGDRPGTNHAELVKTAGIPIAPGIDTAIGPAELLRRRPDIIMAERKLAASNAKIGQAISEYYPKITLSALIGTVTSASTNVFTSGANRSAGILGLRWRLFDFGRVDAEVAAAKDQNAEALASYRLSVLKATADVENAFYAVVKNGEQQTILASGEQALQKARDNIFAGYKSGTLSLLDVLYVDRRLLKIKDDNIQAQSAFVRSSIQSYKALGGGWDV